MGAVLQCVQGNFLDWHACSTCPCIGVPLAPAGRRAPCLACQRRTRLCPSLLAVRCAGNSALSGGAVSLYMNSSAHFLDSFFSDNAARRDGGAIYGYGTTTDDKLYHGINELQASPQPSPGAGVGAGVLVRAGEGGGGQGEWRVTAGTNNTGGEQRHAYGHG